MRKYKFTDYALLSIARNMIMLINRDKALFNARGVSDAEITAYDDLLTQFEELPFDANYIGLTMIEVNDKSDMKRDLIEMLRDALGFVKQMYGMDSPEFERVKSSRIGNLSDSDLLNSANIIALSLSDFLPELQTIGFAQSDIDAINNKVDELKTKMNLIAKNTELRKKKTIERIEIANSLYEMTAKYSMIGKLIWRNTDRTMYNQYLIYKNFRKKKKNKKLNEENEEIES